MESNKFGAAVIGTVITPLLFDPIEDHEEYEEEVILGEGIISTMQTAVLRKGDKVRIIKISPFDAWKGHEGQIVGNIFQFEGDYYNPSTSAHIYKPTFTPAFGTAIASAASMEPFGLVLKADPNTLLEIIDYETETEMRTKTKATVRISPVTGRPVRAYKKKPEEVAGEKKVGLSPFVTLNGYFKLPRGIYNIMKRNILKGTNTLLLGPTGVGKTELVSNLAKELGLPLTIFDMGTMSDPIMSLVGNHVIKVEDGKTSSEFVKSRFSKVIQEPGIILLDELSRASATANNLLFPCLDFRKELAMEYSFEDNTPIKVHPQCIFVATANLGSQYTGTHKLDRALLDRFMLVEIDPLSTQQIKETLRFHCPTLKEEEVSKIVTVYNSINKAHDEYTISFNMSLRHLKMIGELVSDGFTIYDSFYVICKGIGSKEGLKSLESILNAAK